MRNYVLGLLGCFACIGLANAEVVYNNLATGTPSSISFVTNQSYAQRFTATSAFSGIESLTLNLFKSGTGSGSFAVYLNSSNGTTPGANIDTLVVTASVSSLGSSSISTYQITNIALSATRAAGDYWIEVSSNNGADLNWSFGASNIANNPSAVSPTYSNPSWTGGGLSLGGQISVPEPSTLLLGGIAACSGAAGAWWKRRKRKAKQPETTDQPATA